MAWIPILVTYLSVGTITARVTFVRMLGDSPRIVKQYSVAQWSTKMMMAFWCAFGSFFFWPAMLFIFAIFRQTPREKYKELSKELEKEREKVRQLAQEYDLPTWQFEDLKRGRK